jgi:hypothetical protein
LGVPGVLIFVEQHHPVALPELCADLRRGHCQLGGRRHLSAEVHHLLRPHAAVQFVDEGYQFGAFVLGGQQLEQPLRRPAIGPAAAGGQVVDESFQLGVGVQQCGGVDQMLGQRTGQPQHQAGHRGRRLLGVQDPRMFADHPEGQLPQLGCADEPGVRFDRQQQSVIAEQRSGEGVVGTDGGRVLGADVAADAGPGQSCQPGADAPQQLTGGLSGEGEAENLTGPGISVGHQPDHPGGHRLGLSGSGAGDDDQRARWGGDHRGLFGGGCEQAQRLGQFGGAVQLRCGHDRPSGFWAGQMARTGQCPQPSLARATNCGPWVAAAAAATVSRHCRAVSAVSAS